jgi:hypothetical protein
MSKTEKQMRCDENRERQRFLMYGPRKIGAFSDLNLKKSLHSRVLKERAEVLKPRMLYIRCNAHRLAPKSLLNEIEQYMLLSNEISCKMKPSFTMEEAAMAEQLENGELSAYICRSCGFVHFGHDPSVLQLIKNEQLVTA